MRSRVDIKFTVYQVDTKITTHNGTVPRPDKNLLLVPPETERSIYLFLHEDDDNYDARVASTGCY